jgi:uncharacterized lipoprotein YmbA
MKLLTVLLLLFLGACAGQPSKTNYYLLRSYSAVESRQQSTDNPIVLKSVTVASYLDQPGIVLETTRGQIHQARNHLWAEPLRVSLPRFLANETSAALKADIVLDAAPGELNQRQVTVTIDQLHGTADGSAVLLAYWEVTGNNSSQRYQFTESQPLNTDGYNALVGAEKQLLGKLAAAIARSLQ